VGRSGVQALLRALLWFDGPLAALALSAAVALGVAWEKESARQAVQWLWAGVLVYALLSRLCRADAPWRVVGTITVLAGAAVGLYVVLQFPYLGYDIKVAWLSRIGTAVGGLVPRIGDWAPMPNSVATLLEGLVPLAAALAASAKSGRLWRLGAAAGGLVMLLAIALVASRGAWVALGVGCLAWAFAWGWATRAGTGGKLVVGASLAVGLLLVLTATRVVAPSVGGLQLSQIFDRPDRLNVYRNSLVLIQDFPVTGIGPGNQFAMTLSRYALLIQVPFLTYAHNLYLSLWLELGLFGIASWAALIGSVLAAFLAGERAGLGTWFRGAWIGVLVVLVHGLMDARQVVDRWTWLPLFVLLGFMAARLARERVRVTAGITLVPVAALLAFLALASPFLLPAEATWRSNQGMLAEARAELGGLPPAARAQSLAAARLHFERAVELNPRQPTARRRLGLLAIDDRRFDEALANLQIAWEADYGNPATRKAFGLACAWAGRLGPARELLAPVHGIVDELNVWSWYWDQQGQRPQAIYAARLSLMMHPGSLEVARRLADLERAGVR
jgi:putative inorganic carbon (hco3(-)) transporter